MLSRRTDAASKPSQIRHKHREWGRFANLPLGNYAVITPWLLPSGIANRANAGDGFILDSAVRLIGRRPSAFFSSRSQLGEAEIDRINGCDAVLVAGANTLKDRFEILPGFDLRILDRIKVPVALMGVGHYGDPAATANGLFEDSCALLRALLERFPVISVRCDASKAYVERALPEFADQILMTSCPVAYPVDRVQRGFQPREVCDRVVVTLTDRARIREQLWMLDAARGVFSSKQYVLALHQDYGNEALWRYAQAKGYRVFRSPGYEDFIALYANSDIHFGNRLHAHLKCLSLGVRSFLAPFDLRQRFFAESLRFPLVLPGETEPFRTYDFAKFLEARRRATSNMVRFVERFRALLQ